MLLADQPWTPVTLHEIVAAFLLAERHKFNPAEQAAIDQADLTDPVANHRRLKLLYQIRGGLLVEIPPDTQWFKVTLTDADLDQLHIIARCGWDAEDGSDHNELRRAARRKPKILQTLPPAWAPVILWGHSKDGPLTIMEGNNRLTGYVGRTDLPPLQVAAYIGLSPTGCYHHLFDPAEMLDPR